MGKTYLPDPIPELKQGLLRLGYTKRSMTFYHRHQNQLIAYTRDRDECYYIEQLGMGFPKKFFGITQEDFLRTLPQVGIQGIRAARIAGDLQLHHAMLRRYLRRKEPLTTLLSMDIRSQFQNSREGKGYPQMATEHYVKRSSYLMDYLAAQETDDLTAITLDTANTYIRTLVGFSYKTMEQRICPLRVFLRFLNQEGIMPDDLATKIPMVKARRQTAISSIWTQEELRQLVRAVDRGSPKGKRGYVITLIACRLGPRYIDVKNLCFENFNWIEKKLCFTQSKTGQPTGLPLVPDAGWAVIDYLKYGRPKVDSSRIFVRYTASFLLSVERSHLDQLIRAYMVKTHIPMRGKHQGTHSLRHTIASALLEKDIPLPVISDIIGHLDANSTAVYLKMDMKQLAECPLDFEEVTHLG